MMNMILPIRMIMKHILIVMNNYGNKLSGNGSWKGKMNSRKSLRKKRRRMLGIVGLHLLKSMKKRNGRSLRMMGRSIFLNRLLPLRWMSLGRMFMREE